MQHRAILRPTKTGTITYAQALKAARAAKEARLAGGANSPKIPRVADIFGFGFGPAMGDPKGPELVRVQKPATKKRASGRATRSSNSRPR